jgi:hypothetical protein
MMFLHFPAREGFAEQVYHLRTSLLCDMPWGMILEEFTRKRKLRTSSAIFSHRLCGTIHHALVNVEPNIG